jgi:hypothetical protein
VRRHRAPETTADEERLQRENSELQAAVSALRKQLDALQAQHVRFRPHQRHPWCRHPHAPLCVCAGGEGGQDDVASERTALLADLEAARRALAAEADAKVTAVARVESVLKLESKGLADEVYVPSSPPPPPPTRSPPAPPPSDRRSLWGGVWLRAVVAPACCGRACMALRPGGAGRERLSLELMARKEELAKKDAKLAAQTRQVRVPPRPRMRAPSC